MPRVELADLLAAGAHFGHLTRRWNPKMKPYIFMERNGIHIIDLKKTQTLIDDACNAMSNIVAEGKKILFVGTKKQAKDVIYEEARRCNQFYVSERWLGGAMTNFTTIRKSVKRLTNIEKMETDGTFDKITKKEGLFLTREKDKLNKILSGVVEMTRLPGALFVVDIKKEAIAVKESRRLGIPVFAIVDTNCDPELADYVIPAIDQDTQVSLVAPLTQACFNPARDFGPRLFAYFAGWGPIAIPGPRGLGFLTVYLVAPTLGATAGASLYDLVLRSGAGPATPLSRSTPSLQGIHVQTTRLILVGGFLGAGKTTLLAQATQRLVGQGKRVGLVTNDQAANLVDTAILQRSGAPVQEVAGGCFCCRFENLLASLDKLREQGHPDVLIGEPVGSCTDLSATVLQPIKDAYRDRFRVAPFSVLVDVRQVRTLDRLRRSLADKTPSRLPASVMYIYRKQLEEADLIVLNKADLLSPGELAELEGSLKEAFPRAPVLAMSALRGEGTLARYLRRGLIRSALLGAALLPLFPLADPLILFFYGTAYAPAVPLFRLLLGVVIFDLLASPLLLLAFTFNRPRLLAGADALRVGTFATVAVALIPGYGPVGAVVARLAARIAGAVLTLALLSRSRRKQTPRSPAS